MRSCEMDGAMKLIVGADHAGYELKAVVVHSLRLWGHEVEDVGTDSADPVDFPDITRRVCDPVRGGEAERGILVCGTGIGASMAANKLPGIRAALAHDIYSAHQCVEHDDANVLCLGAQIVGDRVALELIQSYLGARLRPEEQFKRRIAKMAELEREAAKEIAG
jgi:ribose 5-phosphate isomerase B